MFKKFPILLVLTGLSFSAQGYLQVTKISTKDGLRLYPFSNSTKAKVTSAEGVVVGVTGVSNRCVIPSSLFIRKGISPDVFAAELNNLAASSENVRLECYVNDRGTATHVIITDQYGLNGTLID